MNALEILAAECGMTPEQLARHWRACLAEFHRLEAESVITEAENITKEATP